MAGRGSENVYICVKREQALQTLGCLWFTARFLAKKRGSAWTTELVIPSLMETMALVTGAIDYFDKRHEAEPADIAIQVRDAARQFPPDITEYFMDS